MAFLVLLFKRFSAAAEFSRKFRCVRPASLEFFAKHFSQKSVRIVPLSALDLYQWPCPVPVPLWAARPVECGLPGSLLCDWVKHARFFCATSLTHKVRAG